MDRITVVSADGHVGCPIEDYRPYLDPAYRGLLDELLEEDREVRSGLKMVRTRLNAGDILDVVDERGVVASGEYLDLYHDVSKRVAQLDAEGITTELVIAGSENALPFFHELNKPYPADVRAAGTRAYHRWLADVLAESKGRLLGCGYPLPLEDIDEVLAELKYLADNGYVSLSMPCAVRDPGLPSLLDSFYEPVWAACADYGLVLNLHAGWDNPQGIFTEVFKQFAALNDAVEKDPSLDMSEVMLNPMSLFSANLEGVDMEKIMGAMMSAMELDLGPRQALWQLMLGGVFDRHPNLKLALTEVRADWVPATIDFLDRQFATHSPKIELKPSEYFARNCGVTPSGPHRVEIEMRHEIGIDQFMFGADTPHPEGTWPNTRNWLNDAFRGVPEGEVRKILGENAIRFYNLDRKPLDEIAARIGPTMADISSKSDLDERMISHWDARNGYLKAAEKVDTEAIGQLLEKDFA